MNACQTTHPLNHGGTAKDYTYRNAHGVIMVTTWIVFASTGILFARYGRSMKFGSRRKLLGEAIWFQMHRLFACLTTVLTLLAFFFVLVYAKGTWVKSDEGLEFAHSVIGGIVVSCALVQTWMALFRCSPDSSYRFIFNWLHRLLGSLSFFLSVPTIFTIAAHMEKNRSSMMVILSLWSTWIVILVIIMEIIRYYNQKSSSKEKDDRNGMEFTDTSGQYNENERKKVHQNNDSKGNNGLLILFVVHIVVSISLAIPLCVYVRK